MDVHRASSATRSLEHVWAAGFLEGEGFFQKGRWVMGAGQVNKEPLERLQSLFGGKIYHRKQDPKVRRDWWGWELVGKQNVLDASAAILPFLSEDRKQRIPWLEQITSRNVTAEERDPRDRFSLYRLCDCPTCGGSGKGWIETSREPIPSGERCPDCRGEGKVRQEIATCETPEAVGVAIVTLGREQEWEGCAFGLLDRDGETGRKWLVLPWLPSARNVRDAARTLRGARK